VQKNFHRFLRGVAAHGRPTRLARIILACALGSTLASRPAEAADAVITVGAQPEGPVNRNVFGGAYNDVRGNKNDWAAMGLATCREGTPGLGSPSRLQRTEGVWEWRDFDAWLDWLKTNQTTGIALLNEASDWMMKGGKDKPADWDYFIKAWAEFAAGVVRHANIERKAGIRYWEIWNEPDGMHWFKSDWGGDPSHYSALFNAAAKAMKAVDPTIRIGTGGIADPWGGSLNSWFEPCLRDGGVNKTLDFVCLHGYYGDPTNNCWFATLDHTRELTRKYMGREVPIWVTEFNANSSENFVKLGTPFEKQAFYVAETLAIFAAERVDAAQYFCVGWYGSDFCPWENAEGGKPRPVVSAYAFWSDYRGEKLPTTVTGADRLAAVACRDKHTTTLYFPADHPGSYTVRFTHPVSRAQATASAFTEGKTETLAVALKESAIRLDWPEGKRALVKIQVEQK